MPARFLTLADVAELLNISAAQTYALVRSGDLPAIKVGGRGQWRVEATELEAYIQRLYAQTRDFVDSHPFGAAEEAAALSSDLDEGAGDDLGEPLGEQPGDGLGRRARRGQASEI